MSVFDGRMRYDLELHYLRMEKVEAEKGYQGAAVVCQVQFTPVAGHVPTRAAIKYLAARRDMEVWFVPIGGTRILAPFRVVVPTPLGSGTLEAQQFVVSGVAEAHADQRQGAVNRSVKPTGCSQPFRLGTGRPESAESC